MAPGTSTVNGAPPSLAYAATDPRGASTDMSRLEVRPRGDLHDLMHAVGGDRANLLSRVGIRVADHVVGARRASQVCLGVAADRGDDLGARPSRELNRGVPDGAGATGDENHSARRARPATAGSGHRRKPSVLGGR